MCLSLWRDLLFPSSGNDFPNMFAHRGGITKSPVRILRLSPFAKNAKDGAPGVRGVLYPEKGL